VASGQDQGERPEEVKLFLNHESSKDVKCRGSGERAPGGPMCKSVREAGSSQSGPGLPGGW
jgi:hypothetical protein